MREKNETSIEINGRNDHYHFFDEFLIYFSLDFQVSWDDFQIDFINVGVRGGSFFLDLLWRR